MQTPNLVFIPQELEESILRRTEHFSQKLNICLRKEQRRKNKLAKRQGRYYKLKLAEKVSQCPIVLFAPYNHQIENKYGSCQSNLSLINICINHLQRPVKSIMSTLQESTFSLQKLTVDELGNILAYMILRNDPLKSRRKIPSRRNVTQDELNMLTSRLTVNTFRVKVAAINQIKKYNRPFFYHDEKGRRNFLEISYVFYCYHFMKAYGINILAGDGAEFDLVMLGEFTEEDGSKNILYDPFQVQFKFDHTVQFFENVTGMQQISLVSGTEGIHENHVQNVLYDGRTILFSNNQDRMQLSKLPGNDSSYEDSLLEIVFDCMRDSTYPPFEMTGSQACGFTFVLCQSHHHTKIFQNGDVYVV